MQGNPRKLVYDLIDLVDSDDSSKKTSMSNVKDLPVKNDTHSSTSKPKLRTVTQAQKEEIAKNFSELDSEGMIQAAKLIKIGLHESGKHEMADQADKALGAGNDIDLQLDEIPDKSLHELLRLVRKSRRSKTVPADVVMLDDDEPPRQLVSSPFQLSQSKGTGWPLRKGLVPSTSTAAKGPQLSQTSSPLPAASARFLPLSSTSKPQRHSPSKLKTEVLPPRQQVLKKNPGVDIHDLTGDVEVIDLDDEYPAPPKRLNAHERSAIQAEILGKELSNCTVAKVLFHEQQNLNEDQWRTSLQQMKSIFEQFPGAQSSISNFKSSRDMPNYNATARYASTAQPRVSSVKPTHVEPLGVPATVLQGKQKMDLTAPLLSDRLDIAPSLIVHNHQPPQQSSQPQPLVSGSDLKPSGHITQPPRKTTPPARAKKNPGHSTMRMVKSRLKAGVGSETGSNAGAASPVIRPVTMSSKILEQTTKDSSTIIPVQSIEESVSTLPSGQKSPQVALLNSRQFRRLQAPQIDRPVDDTERIKHPGRQVSTSSTPDSRQVESTPDIIGSSQVANTMQAHIEEYKLSHLTLVKVSLAVPKSNAIANQL